LTYLLARLNIISGQAKFLRHRHTVRTSLFADYRQPKKRTNYLLREEKCVLSANINGNERITMGKICKAKAKRSGKQCGNWAITGKDVCRIHGGKSTGPKNKSKHYGNQHGRKYGSYIAEILKEDVWRLRR